MVVECPGCTCRYDVTGRPPGTKARCRCGSVFALPEQETSAGQLSCPGCGANVPPTDHTCSFCSAALKVKACPRCFAKIFHESKHCNKCGAKVARPAEATTDGEARIRSCPRCEGTPLEARLVSEVLLDECPGCHGVFLDVCAVETVVRERRQASAKAIIGLATGTPPSSAAVQGRLYISCPDCDQIMNRVNFGRRSGIIVDVCKPHGTWFDQDELPAIVDFVMGGGLEESERREAQALRDDARRRESSARASAQMAAMNPTVRHGSAQGALFGSMLGAIGRLLIE